jgi:hypothetical protein
MLFHRSLHKSTWVRPGLMHQYTLGEVDVYLILALRIHTLQECCLTSDAPAIYASKS